MKVLEHAGLQGLCPRKTEQHIKPSSETGSASDPSFGLMRHNLNSVCTESLFDEGRERFLAVLSL